MKKAEEDGYITWWTDDKGMLRSPTCKNYSNTPWNLITLTCCSDEHTACYRNENLNEIPRNISQDTKTLDLSGNAIVTITIKSFPNAPRITSLSLSENSITNIEPGSLDNLTEIKNLQLDGNNLTSIPSGLFRNQAKLENLNLGENSLQNISCGMWKGLTTLRDLRLTGNNLINICPGAFSNLPQLHTLQVDTNIFNNFYVQLLNLSTYPDTKKTPKVNVEDVKTIVCDETLCRIRKLVDEGVKVSFSVNGTEIRHKCSNIPDLYWDQMNCSDSGKLIMILDVVVHIL